MLDTNYNPLFELGMVDDNPAVKVVTNLDICPANLAALVTVLFETVCRTIQDKNQLEYEQKFFESLSVLMKERHNYDITIRDLNEDE